MKISSITPLRREWSDGIERAVETFEALFNDGAAVYVSEAELMSYRRFQREVLRQLGVLWSYEYAEMRGGPVAWRTHLGRLLQPPETFPQSVRRIADFRRQQREAAEAGAA